MTHHPSPSQNAPNSIASSAPTLAQPMNSNPRGSVIEIPSFLPLASSTSPGTSAAADTDSPFAAADFSSAPGMALTQEQNSEPLSIPSFLHCARPAHDAIKPELVGTVIPIASANNVATGESAC